MARRIGREPTLDEVISVSLENRLDDVYTGMPGQVVSFDAKTQTASIKPAIKRNIITPSGVELTPESIPVIQRVPVIFQRAGESFISLPLKKGHTVLLLVCDRSIDAWADGDGGEVNPVDLRTHDISDAVAYPGLYPFTKPLKDVSDEYMVIGRDGDILMKIRETEVEFHTKGSEKLSVAIAEKLEDLYTKLKGIKETFDKHLHATGVGPSGPPQTLEDGVVTFPPWNSDINSNKVKLPEN